MRAPSVVTLRRLLVFAMNATGFAALFSSGEVSPLIGLAFSLALVIGWFWSAPRVRFERWSNVWTGLTLLAFAASVYGMVMSEEFAVSSAMNFGIFLAGAKLFQLAEPKDYPQSMALSLVLLASGSVLNETVSFGVAFAAYTLIATLALVAHHLTVEVEAQGRDARTTQMERAIAAATLTLSVGILVGALGFFFAFPRVGFGFFMQQSRNGIASSGFGDDVELGGHGTIREDATVVMRVEFPEGPPAPPQSLYFRGLSLNAFTGRGWMDTDDAGAATARGPAPGRTGMLFGDAVGGTWEEAIADTIEAHVYLEPLGSDVLFSVGQFRAIALPDNLTEVPQEWFGRDWDADDTGSVEVSRRSNQGFAYHAFTRPNIPTMASLEAARYPHDTPSVRAGIEATLASLAETTDRPHLLDLDPMSDEARRVIIGGGTDRELELVHLAFYYLTLPEGTVTPRMQQMVERIRAENPTDIGFTLALEEELRRMTYTTDLPQPSGPDANLVDEFLFEWQRGHCEYYATAAAVILRAAGIPARIVNGFLGADLNSVGNYYAVRQANAHSWIEVYFPGSGWVQFDPTPGGTPDMGGSGLMRRLNEALDAARLAWFRWVIEYDLEKQAGLVRDALNAVSDGERQAASGDFAETLRDFMRWVRKRLAAVILLSALWFIAGFLFQRRARLRHPWGAPDWAIGAVWLALSGTVALRFWPGAAWEQALLAFVPVALTVTVSKLLRDDLFDTGDGPGERGRGSDTLSFAYARLVRAAEREVGALPRALTARELVAELDLEDPAVAAEVAALVSAYERVRFAGATLSDEEQRAWRSRAAKVQRAVIADLRRQARAARRG